MAKVAITLRSGKTKRVNNFPVASGLVANRTPDVDDAFNITHIRSGLAVMLEVPDKDLPTTIGVLNQLEWDTTAEEISGSAKHSAVVRELVMDLNKKRSLEQETKIAADLGGRVQPASGARWGYRRDVVTPTFLVEAKVTEKGRYSIKGKDFDHLVEQAYLSGKLGVYIVELLRTADIVVMKRDDLEGLIGDFECGVSLDNGVRKNLVVNKDLVKVANENDYVQVKMPEDMLIVMNYGSFIETIGTKDD